MFSPNSVGSALQSLAPLDTEHSWLKELLAYKCKSVFFSNDTIMLTSICWKIIVKNNWQQIFIVKTSVNQDRNLYFVRFAGGRFIWVTMMDWIMLWIMLYCYYLCPSPSVVLSWCVCWGGIPIKVLFILFYLYRPQRSRDMAWIRGHTSCHDLGQRSHVSCS